MKEIKKRISEKGSSPLEGWVKRGGIFISSLALAAGIYWGYVAVSRKQPEPEIMRAPEGGPEYLEPLIKNKFPWLDAPWTIDNTKDNLEKLFQLKISDEDEYSSQYLCWAYEYVIERYAANPDIYLPILEHFLNCEIKDGEFIINRKQTPRYLTPEIFVPLYIYQRRNRLPEKDIEYTVKVISRYVYARREFNTFNYMALIQLASFEREQPAAHPAAARLFSGYLRAYLRRENLGFEELCDIYNFISVVPDLTLREDDILDLFARRLLGHMPAQAASFEVPGFYDNQQKILPIFKMVQWLNGKGYRKIPDKRVSPGLLKQLNIPLKRFGKYADPDREIVFVFPGELPDGTAFEFDQSFINTLKEDDRLFRRIFAIYLVKKLFTLDKIRQLADAGVFIPAIIDKIGQAYSSKTALSEEELRFIVKAMIVRYWDKLKDKPELSKPNITGRKVVINPILESTLTTHNVLGNAVHQDLERIYLPRFFNQAHAKFMPFYEEEWPELEELELYVLHIMPDRPLSKDDLAKMRVILDSLKKRIQKNRDNLEDNLFGIKILINYGLLDKYPDYVLYAIDILLAINPEAYRNVEDGPEHMQYMIEKLSAAVPAVEQRLLDTTGGLEVKAISKSLAKLYQRTGYKQDDAAFQYFLRNFEAAMGDGLSNEALRGKLREYRQTSPALKSGKASSPLTYLSHNFKVAMEENIGSGWKPAQNSSPLDDMAKNDDKIIIPYADLPADIQRLIRKIFKVQFLLAPFRALGLLILGCQITLFPENILSDMLLQVSLALITNMPVVFFEYQMADRLEKDYEGGNGLLKIYAEKSGLGGNRNNETVKTIISFQSGIEALAVDIRKNLILYFNATGAEWFARFFFWPYPYVIYPLRSCFKDKASSFINFLKKDKTFLPEASKLNHNSDRGQALSTRKSGIPDLSVKFEKTGGSLNSPVDKKTELLPPVLTSSPIFGLGRYKQNDDFPGYLNINGELEGLYYLYADALVNYIKSRKGQHTKTLYIGAGRGKAIVELLLVYPFLEIYSVNKEKGLRYDLRHLKNEFPQLSGEKIDSLYSQLQSNHRIMDVASKKILSRLPDDFDCIVMGYAAAMHIPNQIALLERLFLKVKVGGHIFTEINSAVNREKEFIHQLVVKEIRKSLKKENLVVIAPRVRAVSLVILRDAHAALKLPVFRHIPYSYSLLICGI